MPRKSHSLLLALMVVFALAMVTVVFLSENRNPPPRPLPNPNGYDDFLKAAALLSGDVGNASALDHDGLRALVSTNSESLRLARLGLSRQCALPADARDDECYEAAGRAGVRETTGSPACRRGTAPGNGGSPG